MSLARSSLRASLTSWTVILSSGLIIEVYTVLNAYRKRPSSAVSWVLARVKQCLKELLSSSRLSAGSVNTN